GAKPEELVTDPNKRSETAPEWVQQASAAQEANPTPQPPANIESLGASAQEQDDAVAWLESLAAKHGAKPEELVTDPNKRSETAPEWVQQASAANEAKADPQPETAKVEISESAKNIGEQFFAEFEEAATAQPAAEDPAAWLKDLDAEPAQPAQEAKLPDWMGDAAQPTADDHFISQNLSQDDLANWLDNLDDGEKQPAPQFVAPEKDDLPNWLSGIDSDETPQPNAEPEKTASTAPEPAPASETGDNIPAWLQGVDEPSAAQELDDDDAPPWLRRESWEAEEKTTAPKPVTSADWHPMEAASQTPPKEVAKPVAQAPKVAQPVASPKPQPAQKQPKKAAEKREPQTASAALSQAKGELDRGDIPAALEHYEKLIKRGKHLEETIRDLTESIYRYPVEVGIWQTLGDAYMRANRLKEALEAYNKAEELIR
ncbi:MAG: tetratricopeptide repeat protein, partial [Anaerolineales bacterium]|nr:tetratricopeptide repeat protein [Anaerolineales bacterium]